MRVLVVDDSKAMRAIVKRHVQQAAIGGVEIEEAEDGERALAQIRESPPDVVLSDWNMPNMTGIELLEAMHAEGLRIPFGFVTSESQESYKDRAFDAGALFMIAKPFTPEDFVRHLARFA